MIQDIFPNRLELTFRNLVARLDGSDEVHLDKRELAVAEWHPCSNLPKELTDISIAYEMIEALRIHEKGGLE